MIGKTKIKKDENGNITEIIHSDYAVDPDSIINPEAVKLVEDLTLKEATTNEFYVAIRTNLDGSEYTFKKVNGSKLNKEYFAYQSDVKSCGWSVTDIASGVSVKLKLPTVKACKEFLTNLSEEDAERLAAFKQKPVYKRICQELEAFKAQDGKELDQEFPNPKQ